MSEDTEKAPEGQTDTRDYEAEARKDGWVSEAEWTAKGKDPSLHKPAKEFVETGERILPLMKAKVTRLENKLTKVEASIANERKATLEAMQEQNRINEGKIKEALKTAVTKGDGDKVVELQDKLQEVRDSNKDIKQELTAKPVDAVRPEYTAFVEQNPWYTTDEDLHDQAEALGASIYKRNPKMPLDELFEEITRKVKKLNPEKFGKKPASPDAPTNGADSGSKKGIPKDVKAQFERMANLVPAAERKKFLENAEANYKANQE